MAAFRYVVADVFTDTPLQGNQLAVFTDARELPEELLQPLAKEIGFSETVFVYPPGWTQWARHARPPAGTAKGDDLQTVETVFVYTPEADGHARIRIFTPSSELPFAGHPVLGTAFVLAGPLQLPEIRLETGQGVVPIVLERDDSGHVVFGRMQQPIPAVEPFGPQDELFAALGIAGSELPVELYDLGIRHVYVALRSEEAVAALEPDYAALTRLTGIVGVNCFAGSGTRWKTRMFAPADGVPEDPATGSAAGPLAVHLARHGRIRFGEQIEITQGVEIGRPSTLFAIVEGSAERVERVEVGGSAVVVARGEFSL
jgi:trans-2,3-dihydro-3-hydroxyanthranilate isomerase